MSDETLSPILSFQKSVLPLEKMKCLLPEATTRYREAAPFPHIVLDDFFDPEILNRVLEEFPSNKDIQWIQYYDTNQKKLANENEAGMGLFTRYVLYSLNSATFLKFLEEMTGISNLISDPSFRGGGLHNIYRGGKLGVHADFNKHEKFNIDRRLNLLLYLNKDWKEEYGGHIELWDRDMRQCHKRILPIFNRVVVFTTTDCSYHGHPDPLDCPDHMSRKSLALYYYTNGRPEEEIGQHHSTLFKLRPGEAVESTASIKAQKWWRRLKQKWGS